MGEKCKSTKRDLDKNFAIDKIYIIFMRHRGLYIYNKKITMSEFNYKNYIANNPLLNEALKSMGTADEETMKYLQEISREELVALEKQFVEMFDTLGVIRYNASEQLSKGASEISQRIHNFVTIIRQVLKGNPVVKEETINEEASYLDKKEAVDVLAILNTLRDAAREIQTMQYYGTDKMQMLADKIHGTGAMYKIINMLKQEYENKK